jgi:hypothetical protein
MKLNTSRKLLGIYRAARRTVMVYGRKITGAYGVLPTVYGTAELRQMALTVRYGGHTAGNGTTARNGSTWIVL